MFNLRRDPFERADENSNTYWDWVLSHAYIIYAMQALVAKQIDDVPEVPAAPEAGLVQPRRRHAKAGRGAQQRQSLTRPGALMRHVLGDERPRHAAVRPLKL